MPDGWVVDWVNGLPAVGDVAIVSILGCKKDGISEFSYYSFRSCFDDDRKDSPTFQEWLDEKFGVGRYHGFEYPTVDTVDSSMETLLQVAERVRASIEAHHTVVVVDSGGVSRTGAVGRSMGFTAVLGTHQIGRPLGA